MILAGVITRSVCVRMNGDAKVLVSHPTIHQGAALTTLMNLATLTIVMILTILTILQILVDLTVMIANDYGASWAIGGRNVPLRQ